MKRWDVPGCSQVHVSMYRYMHTWEVALATQLGCIGDAALAVPDVESDPYPSLFDPSALGPSRVRQGRTSSLTSTCKLKAPHGPFTNPITH